MREYKKAITSITQAITLESDLYIAVFRLGLLYLIQRQPDQATQIWFPLGCLTENDPLLLFSLGLQHLAKNEFIQCQVLLEKGIKINHRYPDLNTKMQSMLDEIADSI